MPKKTNGSGKSNKPPKLQVVKPHPPEKPIAAKPIFEKLETAPKPPTIKINPIRFMPMDPIIIKPTDTPKTEPVKIAATHHTHPRQEFIKPQESKGVTPIEVYAYVFMAFIVGTIVGMIAASPSSVL